MHNARFLLTVIVFFAGSASADVSGKTYEVTVISSFGSLFTDCYRFDMSGNLVVDLLGDTLTYDYDILGSSPRAFQSTTRSGAPLPIAFHGFERANSAVLINGINEFGDTFVVYGSENSACVVFFAPGAAYRQ